MGPEFFQTRMGQVFYEATVPRIATALERIADAMEKSNAKPEVTGPASIKRRKTKPASSAGEARKLLALPADVYAVLRDRFTPEQEAFFVIAMDVRNQMIGEPTMVALGTVHAVSVHPRDVFRDAISKSAAAIVVAHNHPTGDPTPSPEDVALTRRLRGAGEILGIPVIDHIVVGGNEPYRRYRSIAEWMGSDWDATKDGV